MLDGVCFVNETATTEIYTDCHTLSLHDALPIWGLEPQLLDSHPSADRLLDSISHNLRTPKQAKAIGDIIRAATLDRKEKAGRIDLADGRTLEFAGIPLPDGNGLLTVLDITDSQMAEKALRERNLALEGADAGKQRFLSQIS